MLLVGSSIVSLLLLLTVVSAIDDVGASVVDVVVDEATAELLVAEDSEVPCAGGSCPAAQLLVELGDDDDEPVQESSLRIQQQQQQQQAQVAEEDIHRPTCAIWMAPSPIKKAEEHGFGFGMFTGQFLRAGTVLEEAIFGHGELVIPIYGSETIYENHPPLREYVWDEDVLAEIAVEDPSVMTALFMPGLAAIAPCTANEFNLKLAKHRVRQIHDVVHNEDDKKNHNNNNNRMHRDTNPVAGGIAYRSVSYVAVRDIFPGEELTVDCSDDTFYGGNYFLSRYEEKKGASICLDHLRVQPSTGGRGMGLFLAVAKKNTTTDDPKSIPTGATILSTPVIPIHRKEMNIQEGERINNKQLLLNYCYGHEQSDVLLLPYAPMINALNHNGTAPNAKLMWHTQTTRDVNLHHHDGLHRRQQYHHEELFTYGPEKVTTTHGMSLLVNVVALREIHPGEEITIDYGPQWKAAWEQHVTRWNKLHPTKNNAADVASATPTASYYQTAEQFLARQQPPNAPIQTNQEQQVNPYPDNLEIFCHYPQLLLYDSSSFSYSFAEGEADPVLHMAWNGQTDCLRPCNILDRHEQQHPNHNTTTTLYLYTVRLNAKDNERILPHCLIDYDVIITQVPHVAITILNRPYTADVFLPHAFRHEIQVDFFPQVWMRSKLRRNTIITNDATNKDSNSTTTTPGDEFKRKPMSTTARTSITTAADQIMEE